MAAHPCGTDTEPADIGANVKDPVVVPDIIEPVLTDFGDLAERRYFASISSRVCAGL